MPRSGLRLRRLADGSKGSLNVTVRNIPDSIYWVIQREAKTNQLRSKIGLTEFSA